MSHPSASRSSASSSTRPAAPRQVSRRARHQARSQARSKQRNTTNTPAANSRQPILRKRTGTVDSSENRRFSGGALRRLRFPLLTPHRRKVLGAGGVITLLATATILPTQVSSQAIADSSCEQVVKSGGEISRGQLSSLLAMPTRSTREAVRQVLAEPYCTLPAISPEESTELAADLPKLIEREAYPLAFDPEAWVVVNYSSAEYQGYDFVFKP